MSLWRALTRGLHVLANRARADDDLDEEVRHYLEEVEASALAKGMSPSEARRAARLDVGSLIVVREQVRSAAWEHAISTFGADLQHGARRLRRDPTFAAVAMMTLALGVGLATAIFSAVDAILLEPLPYPDASRIVMIADAMANGSPLDVTFGTY